VRQEFFRTLSVPSPAERAWETVLDVSRVAGWISIVGSVQERTPLEHYTAVLVDRLGPFKLRADLEIRVLEVEGGRRLRARASGEDRQVGSRIVVDATLRLEEVPEGTSMEVAGAYEVTGRVASLGAGSIRKKAEGVLDDFFRNAEAALR
jgi:carbon monoxide dehydrogenase subunit G